MFTSLQQLIDQKKVITTDEINLAENKKAARELQTRLCDLGILDPIFGGDKDTAFGPVSKADGVVGPMTRNALFEFCRLAGLSYTDRLLDLGLLKALVKAVPDQFLPVQFDNQPKDSARTRFARRILRCMRAKGYWIARSPHTYNIVYLEGVDSSGRVNKDVFDEWNDRRIVIRITPGGKPEMIINDQATTEPGKFYTVNPLHSKGAARIAFGQYKAWADGLHQGEQPALVQRGDVRVHRDLDKSGTRNKVDPIDIGDWFGINQHTTDPQKTPELVGKYSAGCLVGRRYTYHTKFLKTVRKDYRYQANKGYLFISAVIAGDDILLK
ncbi:MAG: peptidoglycan-binding protein [Lewinellaceae bacterium]|nr:peptidoglycan-binding protein [Lewinellaceae bacterium]